MARRDIASGFGQTKPQAPQLRSVGVTKVINRRDAKGNKHEPLPSPGQRKVFLSTGMQQTRLLARVQDNASKSLIALVHHLVTISAHHEDLAAFEVTDSYNKVVTPQAKARVTDPTPTPES